MKVEQSEAGRGNSRSQSSYFFPFWVQFEAHIYDFQGPVSDHRKKLFKGFTGNLILNLP